MKIITRRQREVWACVAIGLTAKEAAGKLGITEGTVNVHRRSLYKSLGLRGIAQLTLAAIARGVIQAPAVTGN